MTTRSKGATIPIMIGNVREAARALITGNGGDGSGEHDQIYENPRVLLNTIRRRKEQRRRRLKAVISVRGQYHLFI